MPEPDCIDLQPADDVEVVQTVLLSAAVKGDVEVLSQLRRLQSAFDEPYRTIASVLCRKYQADEFIDQHTLSHFLQSYPLTRRTTHGKVERLTASQVVNLIFATEVRPDQSTTYLQVVSDRLRENQRVELQERATNLAETFGTNPSRLLAEMGEMVEQERRAGLSAGEAHPNEMLELIPYAGQLLAEQRGSEFLGLNSGFPLVNSICNGLDTGLTVLAAPPGRGKTTWLWQVCCQVAQIEKLPVIFVSMEQSKRELRAKALARISKIPCRHLLRGRLRSDDPEDREKLLAALEGYFQISKYLTIVEGDDTTTVDTILDVATAKMSQASRCLIAVDYLQKLPLRVTDLPRVASTRDAVGIQVSALRRIARDLDSPVLAISSENRAGYGSKTLDVFKESGEIEYSADIAMVLTPATAGEISANAEYILLDLNIIKNRNGGTGIVKFKFYPKRAEFIEHGKEQLLEDPGE